MGLPDVSPRGSFRGWVLGTWLTKNKGFIKTVLSAYFTFLTAASVTDGAFPFAQIAGATLLTVLLLGARLLLDAVDFFLSDVKLP